jgi:hypothetical protein
MDSPVVCTIIAKNYLAHARTFCASFLKHHPTGRCYTLIIDEHAGFIDPEKERFALVTLADIPLPERRERFCFKYNVTELATAVKPFFLRWVLETRNEPAVFYFDPDILVTAPLDALHSRLMKGGGLLLTPHLDTDYPYDGLSPDDCHILTSGSFNLGFLGLRGGATVRCFLSWLEAKLADRCVVAHAAGLFVDQKFFDLAPSLFPEACDVERAPGYNVAYWNLHSRTLTPCPEKGDGRWLCNGQTLYFFHFSNYKLERPGIISGFMTRYFLDNRPDLQPIFAFYREELLRHGYEQTQRWPYSFAHFDDGRIICNDMRRLYRWSSDALAPFKNPFASKRLSYLAVVVGMVERVRTFIERAKKWLARQQALRRFIAKIA